MSAFVVSFHHIDLLVSAAIDRAMPVKFLNVDAFETATEDNAKALGRMLWTENVRSVVHRYNLIGTQEEREYQRALHAYRFTRYAGIRASAIAAAVACYDYQCCECFDYNDTPAAFFVRQLGHLVGKQTSDREPWGFDTAAQVQATTSESAQ